MKQRDKHIKDILFSRMFLFAGSVDGQATTEESSQSEEAVSAESATPNTPEGTASSGDAAPQSAVEAPAAPAAATTPVTPQAAPTSAPTAVTTPVPDSKTQAATSPTEEPAEEPAVATAEAGETAARPADTTVRAAPKGTVTVTPFFNKELKNGGGGNGEFIPLTTKGGNPEEQPTVPNPYQNADGSYNEEAITQAREAEKSGREANKKKVEEYQKKHPNATKEELLKYQRELEAEHKRTHAAILSLDKGRNTTSNILVDMAPREGETWSQAYQRWTPEQKAAVWATGGIGALFSLGLATKKKKDMLDYALMIGSPLAGLAAGAGGAAMYHSDPNTINQGRYQHYYKQYTTPTKGA